MRQIEILNEITGNFPGFYFIPLATGIIFVGLALWLFISFLKFKDEGLFSYRTVARLGIGIFFLALGVFRLVFFIRNLDDTTFYTMLVSFAHSPMQFLVYTTPLTILFSFILIISNIALVADAGFKLPNLYASAFGVFIIAASAFGIWMNRSPDAAMFSNEFCIIYAGIFCYLECMFLAAVICAYVAGYKIPEFNKDFLIILGCPVGADGTLFPEIRGRVEKAMEFRKRQLTATGKKALFIPSGGKGDATRCSESQAMANYLMNHGIDESEILIENRSRTTLENMRYSKELTDSIKPDAQIAFVTSNYHVFRSGILAMSQGLDRSLEGLGAKLRWYYWPNSFVREYLGLLGANYKLHLAMMAITALVSLLLCQLINI